MDISEIVGNQYTNINTMQKVTDSIYAEEWLQEKYVYVFYNETLYLNRCRKLWMGSKPIATHAIKHLARVNF